MLFLKDCTIYLDTPILMRRLGYDGLELSVNYTKFIDDLIQAGAEIKIFEHTLEEMWSILFNFKRCIAQNIFDGKGVMTFLNARREFLDGNGKEVLSLDKGEVEENIKNLGIDIIDITDEDNREEKSDLKNGERNYELLKEKLIEADNSYQKYEARLNNDFQSIISIFRLRQKFGIKSPKKLKDGKYFFLVDNYALILALRNYYREINEQSYKNELLLENQIVFELWQNLSGKDTLNRALFRSKCFALNTIDEEFKEALYRETRKIEIYSPEIEINHQLVSNPYLENELFAESIKSDRINDEYLSKTLLNKIEEDKNREEQRHKQELQKKDEEINAKEMEKTQIKNEAQNKYNEQEDALALQKIKSKKDTENALRDYKISLIQKKVEEISSKPMYKLVTLFLGLKREFNREKYLWSKACEIVGETIDFPEHG